MFFSFFFFFNDTATTEIYTLSLHDALPICNAKGIWQDLVDGYGFAGGYQSVKRFIRQHRGKSSPRSEEHTSELQSRLHLVCRLLLEKKKKKPKRNWRYLLHGTTSDHPATGF